MSKSINKPKVPKRKPRKELAKKGKKRIAPKKVWQEIGCSDRTDVFTQEDLPNKRDEVITLNDKKPFHCVELKSFYQYWLSKANDGKDVTNPFTNKEIPEKKLDKIWKQINKKFPAYIKPVKTNVNVVHTWDEEGMQQVLRFPQGTSHFDNMVNLYDENRENAPDVIGEYINNNNVQVEDLYKFYNTLIGVVEPNDELIREINGDLYNYIFEDLDMLYDESGYDSEQFRDLFRNYIDNEGGNLRARAVTVFFSSYGEDFDERTKNLMIDEIKQLIIKDLIDIKHYTSEREERYFKKYLERYLYNEFLPETGYYEDALEIFVNSVSLSDNIKTFLQGILRTTRQHGGARKKSSKKQTKKIRKHIGINQTTGRLNKGYKYSGKILKSGLKQIIKIKK
jgi:hypothetical protein